uniref:Uncharacterized protein n=1 Tax=Ananas comosus var. bracteatus TaxID=296719 RepID=A0A6V7PNQ1_ANACO|nr:unnamed protein product [Ananas comosus var. bracteatus]
MPHRPRYTYYSSRVLVIKLHFRSTTPWAQLHPIHLHLQTLKQQASSSGRLPSSPRQSRPPLRAIGGRRHERDGAGAVVAGPAAGGSRAAAAAVAAGAGDSVQVRNDNLEQALTVMERKMRASGMERLIRRQVDHHLKNSEKRVLAARTSCSASDPRTSPASSAPSSSRRSGVSENSSSTKSNVGGKHFTALAKKGISFPFLSKHTDAQFDKSCLKNTLRILGKCY